MTTLSFHEERVLRLRARGLTNHAVAAELGVSEQTVKNHITSICTKLDVDNAIGAMGAMGWLQIPGAAPIVRPGCGWVGYCSRPEGHRGPHGGFRAAGEQRMSA